jgi:ethanolamine ammonia-lyase large subunit
MNKTIYFICYLCNIAHCNRVNTIMDISSEKLELVRLLLDTDNEKLLKKVKSLLTREKMDETEYLMSSEANRKHLEEGMRQVKEGKTTPISIDDLWK